VENGTVIFIGATSENPYFGITRALVSRTRVFELRALTEDDIRRILLASIADSENGYGSRGVEVSEAAILHLSRVAHGDARSALNALELAVETATPAAAGEGLRGKGGGISIDLAAAEDALERCAILHDKDGDYHYDAVSAFIKSLRGSDPDAALFWLARLAAAGEDPRFLARRMVIFASEDVGMADPLALLVAVSAAQAVEFVGMPECQYSLAQACIHLATAPKSNSVGAYFEARRQVEAGADDEVPPALRDPSRDGKALGHGKGYLYPHEFPGHWVAQRYLPRGLEGVKFYEPGSLGYEKRIVERMKALREADLGTRGKDDGFS
jgi:putative ATPase